MFRFKSSLNLKPTRSMGTTNYWKPSIKPQKRNFEILSTTITTGMIFTGTSALTSLSALGFCFARYKVASPNEYLVWTGPLVNGVKINRHGLQLPLQKYRFINLNPEEYYFDLNALTKEKIDFKLPTVFTIGVENEYDSLIRYSSTLDGLGRDDVKRIILGVLEGEARLQCSQMTIEEIFDNRDVFREKIIETIQKVLHPLGLKIHNANFKELNDGPDSNYFSTLKQIKINETANITKVAVTEENKKGDIGAKENEAITRQKIAQYDAETIKIENEKNADIARSNAQLEIIRADADRNQEIARIESRKAALKREAELQKEVEEKRILMEIEKLRAIKLSGAKVNAEARITEAEGESSAIRIEAEAKLFSEQKKADAIRAVFEAQADGISKLMQSLGNDPDAVIRYLMSQGVNFLDLANANAKAIQGLEPKISVWTTDGNSDSYTQPISNLLKVIPQTFDAIHHQTGMKLMDHIKQDN